jgi:hypothetical protein
MRFFIDAALAFTFVRYAADLVPASAPSVARHIKPRPPILH